MKRVILRIVVVLLTFALGVVTNWLILRRHVNNTPPPCNVEAVSPAPIAQPIIAAAPVAPVAPVPAASPKPYFIFDYDPETFNPYGMFYLMGPKPKEFESFEGIDLEVFPDYGDDPGYITVYKLYPDGSSGGPSAVFALITKRRLVFATSKSADSGVEYRFEGEFLRTDFDSVNGKNIPVLRGVLTRSKDGRTLVERTVIFRFEHMGC